MKLSERVERVESQKARTDGTTARKRTSKRAATTNGKWGEMKRAVRHALLETLGPKLYTRRDVGELRSIVSSHLDEALRKAGVSLVASQRSKFVAEVAADLLGYGPLDPLLADNDITEIMCNAHDDIYIERNGKIERTNAVFIDGQQYRQVIDKIVAGVGRRIDEGSPMVDARLPDGSRVNVVIPPVAVDAPILTIRRFPETPYEIKDLINFGTLTVDVAVVLEACVRGKLNVLVSGGTGTGKTTTLNVLSAFVPDDERIVTIEDAAELRLHQPHVVSLESRPANIEGAGTVSIRDLVRNALRMRPDRIIVGEVRGAEALDMLQAMNTGHEGSLTTVHSNSPRDALSRLETMVLMAGYDLPVRAIRQQIASALDLIIQIERFGDGSRRIVHVAEVQGMEGDVITLQDIYRHVFADGGRQTARSSGRLRATGLRPKLIEKLHEAGIDLPPKHFRDAKANVTAIGGAVLMPALAALLVATGIFAMVVGFLRQARDRREAIATLVEAELAEPSVAPDALADLMGKAGMFTERMLGRTTVLGRIQQHLTRAGWSLKAGEFVGIVTSIAIVVAFLFGLASSSFLVGLAAFAISVGLGWSVLVRRSRKRVLKIEEQLPAVLQLMSGSLEAGSSVLASFELVVEEGDPPLSVEFARVVAESKVGRPLLEALEAVAERVGSRDLDWTVEAIRIQQQTGGKLADTLRVLADFMRARLEVRGEIRTLSAEARLSAKVLTALPIVIGLFMFAFRRGYFEPLYTTSVGRALLIAGVLGIFAGSLWMRRVVRVEV